MTFKVLPWWFVQIHEAVFIKSLQLVLKRIDCSIAKILVHFVYGRTLTFNAY